MKQKEQSEVENIKETLEAFIEATQKLSSSYNALKEEVKKLSEELAAQKNLLRAIIESIHDGVIAVDNQRRILTANQKASSLLGVKEGSTLHITLPQQEEEMLMHTIEGEKKVIKIYRSPLKQDNKEIGEVIVLRDITRERELEEENKRKERLSAMGRMAVTIAHEIRNPLGSIELFAGLIRRGGSKEEIERWAQSIQQVTKSTNALISNLLMFTRPIYIEPKECSIKEIVQECLEAAEVAAREKEAQIVLTGEDLKIWIDEELIKQVLLNLLTNALQAIPEKNGRIEIGIDSKEAFCRISITDNGCGIPREHLSRIFEPFFTTKKKGTGLGLAIAHRIVEAHGGHIKVESVPGKTTFTVYLPYNVQVHQRHSD